MAFRFSILIIIPILGYSFLIFRLYDLQITKGDYYFAKAESRYFLETKRGNIYFIDKNNNRLAVALNKDFPVLYAVPKEIDDPPEVSRKLALILNESAERIEEKISNKNQLYKLLLKKVNPEIENKIKEFNLKGIYIGKALGRFYPQDSVASHLLGFVGPSDTDLKESGHYGIEKFYDKVLTRSEEQKEEKLGEPGIGEDVILTIDANIQVEAERILNKLVANYQAKGGSVIVQDPKTGKILAMASLPNFNPNSYGSFPVANFLNPVVEQIYEPGSIFKVITMAAGIDSQKITPETTYIDKGMVRINGRVIKNWDYNEKGPYGLISMKKVIERSINTGAIFVQQQMGKEIFRKYIEKFGFGEKTGIDLPGEVRGDIKALNLKSPDVVFATASFGQGVAVTPISLINAISAIANGGNLMRPYLNSSLEPKIVRRVISKETAEKVTKMMVSAVDEAEVAKINGYTIAGKTGTAFIPDFKNGGYTDKVINTYVGFGPASDPKFVILIKLNEAKGSPLAAQTVVPAFRELAQFILNYYNIPPDRI